MMKKIKLLDMFCGAGGAAMGYYKRAIEMGFEIEITGIDLYDQPNYPFNFIKDDAISYATRYINYFTHVHASPPCQKWSCSTAFQRASGKIYLDYIQPTRDIIEMSGLPGIIENVPQAPIYPDVVLRGDMFGLKVLRKRHFELINWFCMNPSMPKKIGSVMNGDYVSVFGKGAWIKSGKMKQAGQMMPKFKLRTILETWKFAMGVDWKMKDTELSESIPPAYTHYLSQDFFSFKNINN
jgi:DNA (cytosine-5)-methyltransferase 1